METMNSYSGFFLDNGFEDTADVCDRMIVRDAMSELTLEQRLIISLSVFAGFNSSEIAQILKLKPSSVRSRKKRALAKLKDSLERMGVS